jgi:hypothetical protein
MTGNKMIETNPVLFMIRVLSGEKDVMTSIAPGAIKRPAAGSRPGVFTASYLLDL